MINKILIVIIFSLIFINSSAKTKVYFALGDRYESEPQIFKCFIEGYESAGGKWDGVIESDTVVQNSGIVSTILPYCLANGFELLLRNTNVSDNLIQGSDFYYFNGIQIVACSGDNRYRLFTGNERLNQIALCGAGDTENQTSYYCEFFDTHPYAEINVKALQQVSDTVIVTTDGGFELLPGEIANFSNVQGFANNIDGAKSIVKYVQGSYNKFKIIHSLGVGALKAGAKVTIFYQSYSHAFIGGKMAYIKDFLNCTWWEARYRMRMTASNNGTFTKFDGYGKPDLRSALSFSGSIPEDPYNTLGTIGKISISKEPDKIYITFDSVANASKYEIYDGTSLIYSLPGMSYTNKPIVFPIKNLSITNSHHLWYKALRYTSQTSESEKITLPGN